MMDANTDRVSARQAAEWEGWDAEEYKAKITRNYQKYKAEPSSAS